MINMALRQVLFIRGFNHFGRGVNQINFTTRHQIDRNFVRNIRNRKQETNQNLREYKTSPFEGFEQPLHIRSNTLGKTLAFTLSFTAGSFVAVTIWEYEKIRNRAINALRNSNPYNWMRRQQKHTTIVETELQAELSRIKREVLGWWNRLTPGERVFAPIFGLNLLVFALWRVPRFKPTMLRYFCSNPAGRAVCWPMFLSTFSHYSLFHLFANMYVLHSFSGAVSALGKEQFIGLYLSAGVVSSFASYIYKIAIMQPGLSLGASGAIMAILAYVCSQYPDTKLSILFLPQFQFSAGTAIQFIMGLDLAGVIFRWRFFDHAAHLGGALMGMFWCYYGQHHIWPKREHLVGYWHQLRGKPQK